MKAEEAIKEFAEKWTDGKYRRDTNAPLVHLISDLTALISEHYVAKEEVDKMVREELIKYDKYIGNKGWIHDYEDETAIPTVDEYLESREK